MSTEEEKARNRAKQARFKQRHPDYGRKQKARALITPTLLTRRQAGFRIFELADPRDLDNLPRLIGYCRRDVTPVWTNFWLAKDHSKSLWASWLRELSSLGLEPVELKAGMLGIAEGLRETLAQRLVTLRLRQMNEITTRNPLFPPPWSLRNMMACKGDRTGSPVGYVCSEGTFHFRSEAIARRETAAQNIGDRVQRVDFDSQGRLWFDD